MHCQHASLSSLLPLCTCLTLTLCSMFLTYANFFLILPPCSTLLQHVPLHFFLPLQPSAPIPNTCLTSLRTLLVSFYPSFLHPFYACIFILICLSSYHICLPLTLIKPCPSHCHICFIPLYLSISLPFPFCCVPSLPPLLLLLHYPASLPFLLLYLSTLSLYRPNVLTGEMKGEEGMGG